MKKMKYLLPIIAILVVMLMAGYTYSWFVTGADAKMNVIELRSSGAVSMTFNIDGENQSAPIYDSQVKAFNGQKAVDSNNNWIPSNSPNEDRVYVASYPLAFFVRDRESLDVTANVEINFENIRILKYKGDELIINERLHNDLAEKPEDRFTWEIIWDDDNDGADSVFGPYGKVEGNDFYVENGAETEYFTVPYSTTVNCTFNIIYIGQSIYWGENYRSAPTTTVYDACRYSADNYKGCRFELIVTLKVIEGIETGT